MPDFDSAWKEALDTYFEPFMAFFFADAHREIDWSCGFEMLDKELQQITPESEQGRRVADKLVKVWRTDGQDEWVLVHIEVQSQQEKEFGERMFVYNYRLFDRYNRRVASFAILGDDRPAWRPHGFGYELWGTKIGIQFATAKLKEIRDYAKEKSMPFITAAERYGLEKGLAEGLAKGREEGRQEGRLEAREDLLAGIEALLEVKFAAPGLALLPEIRQFEDLTLLRNVQRAIKQADSPEAVRRLWAKV